MVALSANDCPYCAQQLSPKGEGIQDCPKCRHVLVPALDPMSKMFEAWLPADLGRYCVVGVAGGGGMGRVFRGQNKVTGQVVAIKFPVVEQEWDEDTWHRFKREIAILK